MGRKTRVGRRAREIWLSFTLKQKISILAGTTVLIVLTSVIFNIIVANFALYGFKDILDDNGKSYGFMEAMERESKAFETYVKDRNPENKEAFEAACTRTKSSVAQLPYDYDSVGWKRFSKTWSIRNGYESYAKQRDAFLKMTEEQREYITQLYHIYGMQDYLSGYGRNLVEITLREGNMAYQLKAPALQRLPFIIMAVGLALTVVTVWSSEMMNRSLIQPVVTLAHASRKIARNDFSGEDIQMDNRDEVGELVQAFNKMKHATVGYINTLEEKSQMAEQLHQEELEKLEMEKRLDATNLELLKSQINPHFLFNTLNMIGCMAKLEDADTTERMTASLSNLFRYNLKTPDAVVVLEQELKVVRDYMFLQQMRFGERIQYDIECKADAKRVMVPTFTFQPLVENAIIHGLSKKEDGGTIRIKIWEREHKVIITIADTGVGMDKEELESLLEALKQHTTAQIGIGVGNIYKRIHAMYQEGEFQIYSRKGKGTVVRMVIPQEEP